MNRKKSSIKGISIAVVLVVLLVVFIIGITVATLGMRNLDFVNKDKYNTRAFYAAEAGISRALAKIKADNNWDGTNGGGNTALTYDNVTLEPSGDRFTVWVYNNFRGTTDISGFRGIMVPKGNCYIVSAGKVGSIGNERSNKFVGVMLKRGSPFEKFGLFGDNSVTCQGSITIDAYDSTTGQTKPGDGDTGTNGNQQGAITLNGSAGSIDGSLYVGPGSVLGSGGAIRITGHPTITGTQEILPEPMPMPTVTIPQGLPAMTLPSGGGGSGKTYTLNPGNYNTTLDISSKDTFILTGPGIYVFKGINMTGQGELKVDTTNGPVKIYVDGPINMTGGSEAGGIMNVVKTSPPRPPKPTDCIIYGTNNCTNVDLRGGANAYLGIYAPQADINLRGNGSVYGSLIGKNIWVHGNPDFHYDVALANVNDIMVIKIVSWQRF